MNYVLVATSGQIDDKPNGGASLNCSSTTPCIRLHNGGTIVSFSGTATANAIEFYVDPDSVVTTDGSAKSVQLLLYTSGRVTSRDQATAGTTNSSGNTYGPDTQYDPSWFDWDS